MSRLIAVLRPEPGNRVTAAAIEAAGRTALRLPLFETRPLPWTAPDPSAFDALLLTSAAVLRHGGGALDALRGLPVHAVGEATAAAAGQRGFDVVRTGSGGADELVGSAATMGVRRALHLAGRDRTLDAGGIVAAVVPVYASDALPIAAEAAARLRGAVAMLHSTRAGARLAEIVDAHARGDTVLAAIGDAAAAAAGGGWRHVVAMPRPDAALLLAAAIALAD